ncbi:intermembrane lipid transfer protein VPS13A-like isoform X2 [Halichondria panicea]
MSAVAKLKLNLKPGVDLSLPQLLMGLECEDIVFSLHQSQMKALLLTVESFDRHMVNQKFLKYKPLKGVSKDPRAWWRYAISAVLEEDVMRKTKMWSWKHIKKHRETVKLYVEKYREKTHSINPSSSLLTTIQELEDQLDWFNILVYRKKKKKEKSKDISSYEVLHMDLSKTTSTPIGLHPLTTPGLSSPSMPSVLPAPKKVDTSMTTHLPKSGASGIGPTKPPTHPLLADDSKRGTELSNQSKKPKDKDVMLTRKDTETSTTTYTSKSGASDIGPSKNPTHPLPASESRKVVESSQSKKAKDKDGSEKKGNIFSRWRQKHKSSDKQENASAGAGVAVSAAEEEFEMGIEETIPETVPEMTPEKIPEKSTWAKTVPKTVPEKIPEKSTWAKTVPKTVSEKAPEKIPENIPEKIIGTKKSKSMEEEKVLSVSAQEDDKGRQELYQAIGYSPDEEYIEYPKDFVAHEIHVVFSTVTLELYGQKQKVGTLVTERIKFDVQNRPSSDSVSVRASVGTLEMEGVPNGNNRTTMITSKLVSKDTDATLVNLALEINPLDRPEMDITVNAVLKPLQITYDFATVEGLVEMFRPPNQLHFQELTNAASASWEQLKLQTTAGLQGALQNRKQLDLDIRLHSPYLIMPEGGTYSEQSHLVVVDLGELRVFGTTKDPKQLPKKLSGTDDFSDYYDKFSVNLAGMQVLVAKPEEDWRGAMASGSSPLHIIAPTGFEIQLLKSMIMDDALLATMRVEGTIPGFEINLSDTQVATLVKTIGSQKIPPSLINRGMEYSQLPPRPGSKLVLDNATQLVDNMSLMSMSSFGDDEEEESTEYSIAPHQTTNQDMSRNVFKDVSIKLILNKVAVKLSQTTQKGEKGVISQSPLLDILISDIRTDIEDRKWDTQGSVTMKEVAILDHITTDGTGRPTYLLKTKYLHDGNCVSARFVAVAPVGTDFAAKYTGLKDSVSAQLSLVKLILHRSTIKTIIEYFNTLQPVLNSLSSSDEPDSPLGLEIVNKSETFPTPATGVVNLNDFKQPVTNEFHYDVQFGGIDIVLVQDGKEFLDMGLTGFSVKGSAQPETVTVVASIKDLTVIDPSIASSATTIISKTDKERNFILLNVVQYNLAAHERDPHELDWVDTSLKAEVNRVNVSFNPTFMSNVLEFVKQLEINKSSYAGAAKATVETATATANAIIESTKMAHRLKLDLTLHAPVLELPFTTETRQGSIFIDLGEFRMSNHLKHGHDIHRESMDSATTDTLTLLGAPTVLDCMRMETTSVQIFRRSHAAVAECTVREQCDYEESNSVILEPLRLIVDMTRNITLPTKAFPNVDISLSLDAIKLHMHEEDVHALIMLGVAASRISEVVATHPEPVTTTSFRSKGDDLSAIEQQKLRTSRAASKLKRFHKKEDVTELRVETKLDFVAFDLTTNYGPLLQARVTGLCTKVDVLKNKVLVSGSTTGLSVVDLSTPPGAYSQVVSMVDQSEIVSSLQLTIYIEDSQKPFSPLGKLQANVSQIQLYIPVPFVISTVMFVQRLGIDKAMLETASKTAQDGATAVTTAARDKFLVVDVKVQAPVLIVPTSQEATQGLMVDLGSLSIQNTLLAPADNVGVDAYGFTLSSFKISRVLLDPSVVVGCPVLAERTLLQPFDLLLAVERNLCPWYTKIPTVNINLNMKDLKIYFGSEDMKEFFAFGMSISDQISCLLPDAQPVEEADSLSSSDSSALSNTAISAESSRADSEAAPFEFLRVFSSLTGIEIKLFRDEPKLSSSDVVSQSFSEMEDYAFTSLQFVTMEASVNVSSNNEVNLKASMKDIALCNMQKEKQDRITGNRVIQHYTSNPLKAYTGQIDKPIVSIQYVLRDEHHIITVKAEKLLVLSDLEFMKTMSDYFTAAFDPNKNKKDSTKDTENADLDKTLTKDTKPKLVKQDTILAKKQKKTAPLLKIKVNASIKDLRVALIENVDTPQPQALTLKLSTEVHMQLTETSKFVDLSVVDLGIATSSFFDLDNTTSWVLLPCSMFLLLTGPVDKPAMNIQVSVDPVCLTLSPAIIRLIIHAVQTLMPKQEEIVIPTPTDLWEKKLVSESSLWFFSPVKPHKAISDLTDTEVKGEMLTVTIESVEVYLESESVDSSPGYPVLALTVSAVLELAEWTGQLFLAGDLQCEASYYNQTVSVWEPLIEPLETDNQGEQRLWGFSVKMNKKSSSGREVSVAGDALEEKPQFSLELASVLPLQVTLTKTSLELIKTVVESCSREYGKQVQGSVDVDSLIGAPFTLVNKLGKDFVLLLQPGPELKFRERVESSKLNFGESVNMYLKNDVKKRSYASLVTQTKRETPTVDISVEDKFCLIKNIALDIPGEFYYTLIPKPEFVDSMATCGLVIEVAVTGVKKTITARSSVQFKNQLLIAVDVLLVNPEKSESSSEVLTALKPNDTFSVPLHRAANSEYYVRPSGLKFQSEGPPLSWRKSKHGDKVNLKCVLSSSDPYYIRVNRTEECYKIKRQLPQDDFAHHIFHLHPPLVIHNLLPLHLYFGNPSRGIEPGKSDHIHYVNLDKEQEMSAMVNTKQGSCLQGKFMLKCRSSYINFLVAEKNTAVELTVHIEDESYLKLGVFCPFWMVNKTDLNLVYKEGDKVTNHPAGNDVILLSTNNKKNKIQLCAVMANGSRTEPSKSFSLSTIGSSGTFSCKLGGKNYKFGVEIRLSQFTLTKLVIVTPYYLLVNETKLSLQVYEESTPANKTTIPPEEVIPFWPFIPSNKLVAVVTNSEKGEACSAPFNYDRSDFTVVQYSRNSEVSALCLEVQESESATVVTFSPYYPGCVPVQIINHFTDVTLQFKQDTKSPLAILHTLQPREMMYFTWDDPSGKKAIRWNFPEMAKVTNCKPIDVNKDSQQSYNFKFLGQASTRNIISGIFRKGSKQSLSGVTTPPPVKGVDKSLFEQLASPQDENVTEIIDGSKGVNRGYWKSFSNGLQRVIIFTSDEGVLERIRAENSYSVPLFEASLSLRSIGLSLVDNDKRRELAYIAITQSGFIWQINRGKGRWTTVTTSLIEVLELAYQSKEMDIKETNLLIDMEAMEMYSPIKGKLRRTNHDGLFVKFSLSEKDYSVHAKIGYVQVDNQLPFSVYPQVMYPLPPPPTVASTTEPKPFVEASLILRKNDQSNGYHFKYVHVLVQKMAVNVDLGFILSLVDFFSLNGSDPLFQTEFVEGDIEYVKKSLKETVVPELAEDFTISRSFFDVLHLAPIKVTLSFNIRSVGQNKAETEITTGDKLLELFLHSIGVILTSVQETEMKFSVFHLEYQPQTGHGLTNLLLKHYRNQLLFQLHTLIFGLDVLGNPVSVVRGVVDGAIDLFYEPIKGSVLGPKEFFEGLSLGLRSFFGAGVVGGITGASSRITGSVGDVLSKLTFDAEFINKRQQQKAKPPKIGSKLGGFAKNVFEGVTGVVTQPVKGLQKEGAIGLLQGTGRGLVGLITRPTGGLMDLASGTLDFVTRKTQIGNFEISDIRPTRFIGRSGIVMPFSPHKAIGTALLMGLDDGKLVKTDFYFGHVEISKSPLKFVLVTDRRFTVIERRILTEGWKSSQHAIFEFMSKPVEYKDLNVVVSYNPKYKDNKLNSLALSSEKLASEVAHTVNNGYLSFVNEN